MTTIYLDMDDVVADWIGWACAVTGTEVFRSNDKLPPSFWKTIRTHERMYRDLPLRRGAIELVDWCRAYCNATGTNLRFLTAIPKGNDMPWAPTDKVLWGQQHFPDIPVFLGPFSHQKHMHCKLGDILIDDRKSNCDEWIAAGGLAYQYTEWETCRVWLETTLYAKQCTT